MCYTLHPLQRHINIEFRAEILQKTGKRELESGGVSWCLIRESEPLKVIENKECIVHIIPYVIAGVSQAVYVRKLLLDLVLDLN